MFAGFGHRDQIDRVRRLFLALHFKKREGPHRLLVAARMQRAKRLAQQLVASFGAPDVATARAAAEEEVAFAESLCNHPSDTLIAVHRASKDGDVREAFRTLHPRGDKKPMRAFSFLEVEGEEQPGDEVDLVALAEARNAGPR